MFQARVQYSNGTYDNTVGFKRKCEIQDGGHKTKINDMSARRQLDSVLFWLYVCALCSYMGNKSEAVAILTLSHLQVEI